MERILYVGQCYGGPKDGDRITVRNPGGFVLVNRVDRLAWIYEFRKSSDDNTPVHGEFHVREAYAVELDDDLLSLAVQGAEWDVVAHG